MHDISTNTHPLESRVPFAGQKINPIFLHSKRTARTYVTQKKKKKYCHMHANIKNMYLTGALASKHIYKSVRERERKHFFQERDLG